VWHVGLPKTGTTFLQCTLCAARSSSANSSVLSDETLLQDDQIHYLGTCPFRDCGLSAMPDRPPGLALMRHRASAFISTIARVRDYKVGEGVHRIRTKNLTENKIRSYFASGSTSWGPDPISDSCSYPNCDNRTSYPLLSVAPALLDRLERVRLEYLRTIQSKSPTDDDNGAAPASAVIVFEGSHRFDDALVAAFARYLVGDDDVSGSDNVSGCGRWNVEIVVYYRRLFEWLPSKYNSKMKLSLKSEWPGNANVSNAKRGRQDSPGWVAPPFDLNDRGAFSTYVSLLESSPVAEASSRGMDVQHPVETVRRKFSRYFGKDSVLVVNPHTNAQDRGVVDPSLYHFLCGIVKANNSCRRLTEQEVAADGVTSVSTPLRTAPAPANPSVVMHYDQIAVAAFLHGGLIDHKTFSRAEARQRIQDRHENLLGKDPDDWSYLKAPQKRDLDTYPAGKEYGWICLSNATLDRLWNLSYQGEVSVFGEDAAEADRIDHWSAFTRAFRNGKYCSVDTAAVLRDDGWSEFLKSWR
jgi:hypothetical protein